MEAGQFKAGEVWSWGWQAHGQCAHGDVISSVQVQPRPMHVSALSGLGIRSIVCGNLHSTVVTDTGQVYTFGRHVLVV
jgi:alpha-tubulin suppressor-like RCC1 family protein